MKQMERGIEDYLKLRRTLGFKLYSHDKTLRDFVQFMKQRNARHITTALVLRWATLPGSSQPGWWSERYRRARLFAQHWSSTDPRTEVPPPGVLRHEYRRPAPRIFTNQEVSRIIRATAQLPVDALDQRTYATVFGLLAATGLRIGEALALDCETVDLSEAVLQIRETKFLKSRIVPIHGTTCTALREYVRYRDPRSCTSRTNSFFVLAEGQRPTRKHVYCTLQKIARGIGMTGGPGKRNLRLHEFRHTFVVRTLVRWYRAGVDVDARLPALSTYLGHGSVAATYWYISAVPELLALASGRLEKTFIGETR